MTLKARFSALLFLSTAIPALATDNYAYQPGEYVTISEGRSPDGHWSIAAHGDGPYAEDHFDLYLMREPAHDKPTLLHTGDHLDTGPLSLAALWAPDSSKVAVLYRSDRHVLELRIFSINGGKAQAIEIPTLVTTVGKEHFKPGIKQELFSRLYRVSWPKPNRLALEEYDTFDAAEPIFGPGMEPYLQVDRMGSKRVFTHFSASVTCDFRESGKASLSGIKPAPNWPKAIVYTPNLLFDPDRGLYDTETTLSSLAKQKGQK